MSNGNELNQFLNAMPGWLIQLRQMKQRAQEVKSQQDIQREQLELEQQRTISIIEDAKDEQKFRQLKHELDARNQVARILGWYEGKGKEPVKTLEREKAEATKEYYERPEKEQLADILKTDVSIQESQEKLRPPSEGEILTKEYNKLENLLEQKGVNLGWVKGKDEKKIIARQKAITKRLMEIVTEEQSEQPPPVVGQPQAQLSPEQRFNELMESGMPEDKVYQTLINEGYGQ